MPIEQKNLDEYVLVDLEGKGKESQFEKIVMPDDSYVFKIMGTELIDTKNYKTGMPEKKLLFYLEEEDSKKNLSFFCNPKIMKAREGSAYSNSKLYDVMDVLGLFDEFKNNPNWHTGRLTPGELKSFLDSKISGVRVKAITRTINKGTDKAYSVVDRITRKV